MGPEASVVWREAFPQAEQALVAHDAVENVLFGDQFRMRVLACVKEKESLYQSVG